MLQSVFIQGERILIMTALSSMQRESIQANGMEKNVIRDELGLTLVEVLIASVIMLLVSLSLMQTALLGLEANFRNVLRDEAAHIAEMRMQEARNIPFNMLVSDTNDTTPDDQFVLPACQKPPVNDQHPYPVKVSRSIRNMAGFHFGTRRMVTSLGAESKQVTVLVRWVNRNECYSHAVSSVMGNR
jgi:type II secretory pathway pseudopilin PulG